MSLIVFPFALTLSDHEKDTAACVCALRNLSYLMFRSLKTSEALQLQFQGRPVRRLFHPPVLNCNIS